MRPNIGLVVDFYEDYNCKIEAIVTGVFLTRHSEYPSVNIALINNGWVYGNKGGIPLLKASDEKLPGNAYYKNDMEGTAISPLDFGAVGEGVKDGESSSFKFKASTKVMRSHDYCHFEVSLSADTETLEDVDRLRKDAAKLVDRAVEQYKEAKLFFEWKMHNGYNHNKLSKQVEEIQKIPASERTPKQKSMIKLLDDINFMRSRSYDYEIDIDTDELDEDWESWEDDHEWPQL